MEKTKKVFLRIIYWVLKVWSVLIFLGLIVTGVLEKQRGIEIKSEAQTGIDVLFAIAIFYLASWLKTKYINKEEEGNS